MAAASAFASFASIMWRGGCTWSEQLVVQCPVRGAIRVRRAYEHSLAKRKYKEPPKCESKDLPLVATPCRWSSSSARESRVASRVSVESRFAAAYGRPEAEKEKARTRRKRRQTAADPWSRCWTYHQQPGHAPHVELSCDLEAESAGANAIMKLEAAPDFQQMPRPMAKLSESDSPEEFDSMRAHVQAMFDDHCMEGHYGLTFPVLRRFLMNMEAEGLAEEDNQREEQLLQLITSRDPQVLGFSEFYQFFSDKCSRKPTFGRRMSATEFFQLSKQGAPGLEDAREADPHTEEIAAGHVRTRTSKAGRTR